MCPFNWWFNLLQTHFSTRVLAGPWLWLAACFPAVLGNSGVIRIRWTPSCNGEIYLGLFAFVDWLFCSVGYTQLVPLLIFSNASAVLSADPGWKKTGRRPQRRNKKNHTGSSNRRDALSDFERHRKLEDLVWPLHGDRADILETPFTGGRDGDREREGSRARVGCEEAHGASAEVPPPCDLWAGTHHGVHSQILPSARHLL